MCVFFENIQLPRAEHWIYSVFDIQLQRAQYYCARSSEICAFPKSTKHTYLFCRLKCLISYVSHCTCWKHSAILGKIWNIAEIIDSDPPNHAWSYNYRYLARWSEPKFHKCIDIAKCLYLSAQNFRASLNNAKPASCSNNIQCFVDYTHALKSAPPKLVTWQLNAHICDKFSSNCKI